MDNDNIGLIPLDQPTKDGDTERQRREAKAHLWTIDKAIDQGQVSPLPDDGIRPANNTVVPINKNSV